MPKIQRASRLKRKERLATTPTPTVPTTTMPEIWTTRISRTTSQPPTTKPALFPGTRRT
jgi:hypothetical protein